VIAAGLAAIALLAAYKVRRAGKLVAVGTVLGLTAMLATPAAWALSTFSTQDNGTSINAAAGPYGGQFGTTTASRGGGGFPAGGNGGAFPGRGSAPSMAGGMGGAMPGGTGGGTPAGGGSGSGTGGPGGTSSLSSAQQSLLDYLRQNQGPAKYLMAVMSSGDAEDYIADAGASVLPVGGFSGDDGYPSLSAFKALVASGELRYVLLDAAGGQGGRGGMGGSGSGGTSEISSWVSSTCKTVSSGTSSSVGTLYACTAS
jgi:hypothetical protein